MGGVSVVAGKAGEGGGSETPLVQRSGKGGWHEKQEERKGGFVFKPPPLSLFLVSIQALIMLGPTMSILRRNGAIKWS